MANRRRALLVACLAGVIEAMVACSCGQTRRSIAQPQSAVSVTASGRTSANGSPSFSLIDPTKERPPDPWLGPKGWYAFIEAEHAELGARGFRVVDSPSVDKTVASGDQLLQYDGGKATATATVEVPADGRYLLAVRVGAPTRGHSPTHTIDVTVRHGDLTELTWPLPHREAAQLELHWSSFQWVSTQVDLKAGKTVITLSGEGGPLADEKQRQVDCIVLTADTSYDPDYRDFAPQLYARITMRDIERPTAFAHPVTSGRVRRGPFTQPLANGESTSWLNITRDFPGGKTDVYLLSTARKVDHAAYAIDFASAPSPDHVFKTIERRGPGGEVRIVLPKGISPGSVPFADFELAQQHAELVARLPPVSFGRRPTRFPILTTLDVPESARMAELKVMAYVGINGRTGLLDDVDLANGIVTSRLYNVAYYTLQHGHLAPDYDSTRKDLEADAKLVAASPNASRVQHLKLVDEAHPWPLDKFATDSLSEPKFREFLKSRGYDPLSPDERRRLGPAGSESAVHIVSDPAYEFPGVYYYSQRFRAWTIVDFFAHVTQIAHEVYPPGIRTTQNFSDGAVLNANLYELGNDYFEYFSHDALDVALSEDWSDAAATRELGAWNVALLRAATREKGQPIHMYVIAYSGRRPVEVKIKAMEELSEGAKLLELYDYMPRYKGGGTGWAEVPIMMPAMAELTREIGAAEDVLVSSMPRRAETAIYYSIPSDVWTVGTDESAGLERMFTYVALRHDQIPVDVVSDDQARRGGLAAYKVLYLPSLQIEHSDAQVLASWVTTGGTLVLGPGAGSRDAWNRPSRALDDALHLPRRDVERLEALSRGSAGFCAEAKVQGSVELLGTSALGVRWPTGEADVVAARQAFTLAPDVTELARFKGSGEPAAVAIPRGRGAVVMFGFFPAIDYGCGAHKAWTDHDGTELVQPTRILAEAESVLDPAHPKPEAVRMTRMEEMGVLPFHYSEALRKFLTAPALAGKVARPVALSAPQVVTSFLEGKEGWAIPLANVTGEPVKKLDIDIAAGRPVADVFSSRLGKLTVTRDNPTDVRVSIPLESTDIIYGTWR